MDLLDPKKCTEESTTTTQLNIEDSAPQNRNAPPPPVGRQGWVRSNRFAERVPRRDGGTFGTGGKRIGEGVGAARRGCRYFSFGSDQLGPCKQFWDRSSKNSRGKCLSRERQLTQRFNLRDRRLRRAPQVPARHADLLALHPPIIFLIPFPFAFLIIPPRTNAKIVIPASATHTQQIDRENSTKQSTNRLVGLLRSLGSLRDLPFWYPRWLCAARARVSATRGTCS